MALLRYLQPKDGLPDPRSALSLAVPSQAMAEAHRDVQEATSKKNRGAFKVARNPGDKCHGILKIVIQL